MRAKDIMTRDVKTIDADSCLWAAARLMRNHRIGFLPVMNGKRVIGVITDRDIVVRGLCELKDPHFVTVSEIMTRDLIFCREDDVLTDAATRLAAHRIRRLLVLDREGGMAGLLSLDDLAAHLSSDRLLSSVVRDITARA